MIVEKGYIALTGDKELRADEIRYFLGAPAPSSSLRKYSYARNFVKFLPNSQSTGHRVAYIDSFANEKKRAWYKRRKLCYYWIFALAAFFPIIFFSLVVKAGFINALALAFASLCAFGVIAADALFDYARMLRAEEVVLEHGERRVGGGEVAGGHRRQLGW